MDYLPRYIVDNDRATGYRMHIPSRCVAGIYLVHCWELLPILNRLGNLLGRPPALSHLFLPLLSRMIAAELPVRLAIGHDIPDVLKIVSIIPGTLLFHDRTCLRRKPRTVGSPSNQGPTPCRRDSKRSFSSAPSPLSLCFW